MRLLSVPWSSFPQLKRWLAEPQLACRFNKVRLRALRFDATAFARRVAAGEGWWSRWVTLPHQLACRASALLVRHDPVWIYDLRMTIYDWQAAVVPPHAR